MDRSTNGPTDGRTDGRTDRRTDGPTDEQTDRWVDGPTDKQTDRWADGPTDEDHEGIQGNLSKQYFLLITSQSKTFCKIFKHVSGNITFLTN